MDADQATIVAAVAELSDSELHALIDATKNLPGLLPWPKHTV